MSVPVITGPPEHWPLPGTRCIFRGKLMDYETAAFVMAMEAQLGYVLTVVQGCYTNANPASGGTHGGGGVIDLAPWDYANKVHVARSLGAFAWHRVPAQGPWPEHIHFGIRKHPTLSGAAVLQQRDFDMKPRRNGLANHLVDPNQYPDKWPAPTFHYPPKAPATPTFATLQHNDDFENKASDVAGLVTDFRPLCMGVEEGWRVDYATVVPKRWRVKQKLENKSTAGVAVIYDTTKLYGVGVSHDPAKLGGGWQAIGRGADTRVRGVKWKDVAFRAGVDHGALPARFRLAAVHREPVRDRDAWNDFDHVLATWFKRSPLPVLLYTDSNEHGGPEPLMSLLPSAYAWHGVGNGIDGAVTSLPVRGVKDLPQRTSDHAPVLVQIG